MKTGLFAAFALMISTAACAQGNTPADIYPKAETGQTRHMFTLPQTENEAQQKLEIFASREMQVDCNRVMISAELQQQDVQGWGYPYYKIDKVLAPATTMMACPHTPKETKLIPLNLGPDALTRYNSKLPLVIYAPTDLKIGYRIWSTDGQVHGITEPTK